MRIDYDNIMETIETQFKDILYNDVYYNGYQINVSKEQDFNRIVNKDPMTLYIVVKFQPASLNYRQYLLPITIYALSEQNKLDACQRLLLDYCMQYNLAMSDDQTTKQFYSTPQVISNFEEVYYGYRSMLYMQGTFLVSKDSNPKKFYYVYFKSESSNENLNYTLNEKIFRNFLKENNLSLNATHYVEFISVPQRGVYYSNSDMEEGETIKISDTNNIGITINGTIPRQNSKITIKLKKQEIEIIDYQTTCDIMLDSQPFYNTNNFSKSIGKIGTYLLNLTCYAVDDEFLNKVQAIPDEDFDLAPEGVNTTFYIEIEKAKSGTSVVKELKLVNVVDRGSLGEFPMMTMVFSQ